MQEGLKATNGTLGASAQVLKRVEDRCDKGCNKGEYQEYGVKALQEGLKATNGALGASAQILKRV